MYGWLNTTRPEILTDVQRAARFYYLQKAGFGGKVEGRTFGTATTSPPKLNLLRIEEELSLAHLRLARTTIEHLPWQDCIRRYDRQHTLFYCDSPYYGTEGYGVGFGLEQYDAMAELARTIQGKMVISVNDIPEMRRAFNGLAIDTAEIRYSVGGAGRAAKTGELIVRNFT
jgi:DNA adenine methylase